MSQSLFPSRTRSIVVPGFDPVAQPVVNSPILQPLALATVQLDFIRATFAHPVSWRVEPIFSDSFAAGSPEHANTTQAAVLFPLVQRNSGVHVLFTRRASHLFDHAGQICFPGGRIEHSDHDAVAAAVRETYEEIGIEAQYIQLLGTHPSFVTSTRFTMKPVVGVIQPGFTVRPDHAEVAEVFEVPLAVLMDPSRHRLHEARLPDGSHRLYFSISWQSYFIWGATAALIRNFYHYLAAAQTTLDKP
ncbi:MAG TPA: CoA pyrophosphatase [Candidimonas sp.]|nr:CoA pyrophosphatase [Candidimonas sp.]